MTLNAWSMPNNFRYSLSKEIKLSKDRVVHVAYNGFSHQDALEVFEIIEKSSENAQEYLASDGFSNDDCNILKIKFYDLKTDVINNRTLMKSIDWQTIGKSNLIYAYFDSITEADSGESLMFMTASLKYDKMGLNRIVRRKIIAHEVMHYWQDRTCNRKHDVEDQAQKFSEVFK